MKDRWQMDTTCGYNSGENSGEKTSVTFSLNTFGDLNPLYVHNGINKWAIWQNAFHFITVEMFCLLLKIKVVKLQCIKD